MSEFLSAQYINGVYLPSGILVVGAVLVKPEWVPYAVVISLLLAGYKVFSNSKRTAPLRRRSYMLLIRQELTSLQESKRS